MSQLFDPLSTPPTGVTSFMNYPLPVGFDPEAETSSHVLQEPQLGVDPHQDRVVRGRAL